MSLYLPLKHVLISSVKYKIWFDVLFMYRKILEKSTLRYKFFFIKHILHMQKHFLLLDISVAQYLDLLNLYTVDSRYLNLAYLE